MLIRRTLYKDENVLDRGYLICRQREAPQVLNEWGLLVNRVEQRLQTLARARGEDFGGSNHRKKMDWRESMPRGTGSGRES